MIVLDIFFDGFFVVIVGIGFGVIFDFLLWVFKMIVIFVVVGYVCCYCLMIFLGVDIVMVFLFGVLVIGFGSLWFGWKVYCLMIVFYILVLFLMILGKFVYNMVFLLIMSL